MIKLPKWCILNKFPAVYETESLTAIEQTARLYAKVNELIDSYNEFAEKVNTAIEEHTNLTDEEHEKFEIGLRQEFQDFINVIDLKVMSLERHMKTELTGEIHKLWNELTETGEIQEAFMKTLERIVTIANEQTESIEAFKSDINEEVSTFEERVNTANSTFKNEVNVALAGYNTANEQFKTDVNTANEQFKADVNTANEQFKAEVNTAIEGKAGYGDLDTLYDWVSESSVPAQKINAMGNVLLSKTKINELRTNIITNIANYNLVKVCIYVNGENEPPVEILCNVTNHAGGYYINGIFLPHTYGSYMPNISDSVVFGMLTVDIEGFNGGYINYAGFTDIYSANAPSGAIDLSIDNNTWSCGYLVEIIGII